MGERKSSFKQFDEQIQVQNNKIKESADRTKSDIELLLKEKSDKREKDIDKVRKREEVLLGSKKRYRVINEQLRKGRKN